MEPPPSLPPHCTPTHAFLYQLSHLFSTCIPTPLFLLSSTLGFLSITAWLFAQLPQIIKNYRSRSVEGLSLLFLLNWLLGDVSNLAGAVLLEQMFFQKVIGGYYVVVDVMLMGQFLWYGALKRGSSSGAAAQAEGYAYLDSKRDDDDDDGEIIEGMSPPQSETNSIRAVGIKKSFADAINRYEGGYNSSPGTPGSSRSPLGGRQTAQTMFVLVTLFAFALAGPEGTRMNQRRIAVSPFGGGGGVAGGASGGGFAGFEDGSDGEGGWLNRNTLGVVIAWVSTALYCSSRLPQLHKNYTRRSCSGLSITLFIAAFFGNVFYSLSLLTNPLGWSDYPPYGGNGLVGKEGSLRSEWWGNALPFFLGAAGVLCQDAAIFVQFLCWREREVVVVVAEEEEVVVEAERNWSWREWVPEVPVSFDVVRVDGGRGRRMAKGLLRSTEDNDRSYGTL